MCLERLTIICFLPSPPHVAQQPSWTNMHPVLQVWSARTSRIGGQVISWFPGPYLVLMHLDLLWSISRRIPVTPGTKASCTELRPWLLCTVASSPHIPHSIKSLGCCLDAGKHLTLHSCSVSLQQDLKLGFQCFLVPLFWAKDVGRHPDHEEVKQRAQGPNDNPTHLRRRSWEVA